MSMYRSGANNRLAGHSCSSVCKSSVMNLGNNLRVLGDGADVGIADHMPRERSERNYLPFHNMVLQVPLRCLPICLPYGDGRRMVETRFCDALSKDLTDEGLRYPGEPTLRPTPIHWLMDALIRGIVLRVFVPWTTSLHALKCKGILANSS